MMTELTRHSIILSIVSVLSMLVSQAGETASLRTTSKTPVARAYGKTIPYEEVSTDLRKAEIICGMRLDSNLETPCTSDQLAKTVLEIERRVLRSVIEGQVIKEAIAIFKIEVSREEINTFAEDLMQPAIKEQLRSQWEWHGVLSKALSQLQDSGQNSREVYNRLLKGKISWAQWNLQIHDFGSPERLEALKKSAAGPPEALYEVNEKNEFGVKIQIRRTKLHVAISDLLEATDPQYKEFKAALEKRLLPPAEQYTAQQYLAEAVRSWWAQKYSEAQIEILDTEFRDVAKYFVRGDDESQPDQSTVESGAKSDGS